MVTGFNYALIVDSLAGWNQTAATAAAAATIEENEMSSNARDTRIEEWEILQFYDPIVSTFPSKNQKKNQSLFNVAEKKNIIIIDIPVVVLIFYLGKNDWRGKQESMAVIIHRAKVTSPFRVLYGAHARASKRARKKSGIGGKVLKIWYKGKKLNKFFIGRNEKKNKKRQLDPLFFGRSFSISIKNRCTQTLF